MPRVVGELQLATAPLGKRVCQVMDLVDFRELPRSGFAFDGRDLDGLFACEIARGLQRVDADIHERAAARERALEPPLAGVADAHVERRFDDLDVAELLRARDADALEVVRVVLAAVRDGELAVRGLRVVDHLLARSTRLPSAFRRRRACRP